jgi:hypothetical protein
VSKKKPKPQTHEQMADVLLQCVAEIDHTEVQMLRVGVAQVHATLALVEQQRIANQIALAGWIVNGEGEGNIRRSIEAFRPRIADEIWKGLGL